MRVLVFSLMLILLGQGLAQQVDPFLLPERANSRINAGVEIAKQLKQMGYNRIAVVYMETSDLCALFSASLVASLKTLGVEAYYVKGGEGLSERLKALMPFHVYMAYFGERPHAEVQAQFNRDMKEVLRYEKKPSIVLQPALVALGFVGGLLTDEELSSALQEHPMRSFVFEGGKAKPTKVTLKDLEVKVSVETHTQKPERPGKRK
ncbi:MAG: hypothetical protein N3C13_01330 [Aquificaceae bacterium]|nr:hypothetical protein [Aquificaceae bacterium]MCX8059825.1 hypothetical protein [Aquificaceae bacterium]MDW8097593.1 hypothetical protein [Aquificaceae bacterium]